MTASDTFAAAWTDAEAWDRTHPGLLTDPSDRAGRAERVRWMAVARAVTALEGEEARFTVADDPTAEGQLRTTTVGTVIGRALLGDMTLHHARWLVLVRPEVGPVCAIPEEQVVDIADAR